MSARIFPFVGSPLADIVYLDTSFVWELYNPHADPIRQAKCIAFLDRLHQAEVMIVINSWVTQELRHVILAGVYYEEAQRRRMSWRQLFRQDKSLMPTVIQSIQQVEVLIDALPLIIRLPTHLDLTTDAVALDLMETYNLDAADAYHIAISRADGINSFVTLDQGFGVVGQINLYTCDPTLLQNQTTETAILLFDET
ncbi:type II toxin-antitoxin system VapC family toxin [Candidatus Poribacteria bacterium]|nr:type II toxin-antitoxin system VapC family toxin [Candidatus Poribacteria bacterium]